MDSSPQHTIQEQWKNGYLIGYDCIVYADGKIVIGEYYSTFDPNNGETKQYWSPLCDTELDKITKYNEDIWTACDIFHGSFIYKDQHIVFGDGAMGNEGFVASTKEDGTLNWSIFFTFSNPICKASIEGNQLICFGDTGTKIKINLEELSKIEII